VYTASYELLGVSVAELPGSVRLSLSSKPKRGAWGDKSGDRQNNIPFGSSVSFQTREKCNWTSINCDDEVAIHQLSFKLSIGHLPSSTQQ
jgi:hypothetical protein